MKGAVSLGRLFGIRLRIHFTFLLLLAWIGWLGWSENGWRSSLWSIALILLLFVCVVLHELGHSLMAMRFGVEVRSITLLPIGGVASMGSIPERPSQELLIAVAGPLVNVMLAGLLAVCLGGRPVWNVSPEFPTGIKPLFEDLFRANVIMVVFNMIPAFPMDGGRVARSLLAMFLPYERATAMAAGLGQAIALLFMAFGLWVSPLVVLIGVFVFIGAGSEERWVRLRSRLRGLRVRDVMIDHAVCLHPGDTVETCLSHVHSGSQKDFPVMEGERLVGLLPRKLWMQALREGNARARIGDIMLRRFMTLHPGTDIAKLYKDMRLFRQEAFPVVQEQQLVGLITVDEIRRRLAEANDASMSGSRQAQAQYATGNTSRGRVDLG